MLDVIARALARVAPLFVRDGGEDTMQLMSAALEARGAEEPPPDESARQ